MKRASSMSPSTRRLAATVALLAAFAAPACATAPTAPADHTPPATEETATALPAFPRVVSVPAGERIPATELHLDAEPMKIAVLNYEAAEIAAEIGLSDRLIMIPEAVLNPALGGHVDELAAVPETFPVEADLSAEMVIAREPDLVIMSTRHGAEETIGSVLQQAGIPTLIVPHPWSTSDDLIANVELIGEATGAEEQAEQLADTLREGLHAAEPATGGPRVMVLSNQAGRPFITGGNAFPLELLERAGGTNVSAELGITSSGPISVEQIVEAAPDAILLIDMNGSGTRLFSELLSNPAVAALDAARDENVLLVTGRDVQALGLTNTITGLGTLTDWVRSL